MGLCLSRKKEEWIIIGDDIRIQVIDIKGDKVKVNIYAPRHVSVHRGEVYAAIQREGSKDGE